MLNFDKNFIFYFTSRMPPHVTHLVSRAQGHEHPLIEHHADGARVRLARGVGHPVDRAVEVRMLEIELEPVRVGQQPLLRSRQTLLRGFQRLDLSLCVFMRGEFEGLASMESNTFQWSGRRGLRQSR